MAHALPHAGFGMDNFIAITRANTFVDKFENFSLEYIFS